MLKPGEFEARMSVVFNAHTDKYDTSYMNGWIELVIDTLQEIEEKSQLGDVVHAEINSEYENGNLGRGFCRTDWDDFYKRVVVREVQTS